MSTINDLPPTPPSDAGLEFNYALWSPGTIISLHNVPWGNDYRDVVRFRGGKAALEEYLLTGSGPTIRLEESTYGKPEQGVVIPTPFNTAYKYNYLRVYNPSQPVNGDEPRTFYYFITNLEYLSPNATRVHVQLDVFQTFIYGVTFGNVYVERGHIGIANETAFKNYGRDYLTEPEGLDIGGEYQTQLKVREEIARARRAGLPFPNYWVLITSTVSLTADPGTVEEPSLKTAPGSFAESLPNGSAMYVVSALSFTVFMEEIAAYPWISQGIVSVTAIPDPNRYNIQYTNKPLLGDINKGSIGELHGDTADTLTHQLRADWRGDIRAILPFRYQHLDKFLTYPYCVAELTMYNGTPITLKPEMWQAANATVYEIAHIVPPSQRISIAPVNYNANTSSPFDEILSDANGVYDGIGEFMDFTTQLANFPQFSIVNNSYIAHLASNANSMAYNRSSADWSQQRTLASNQLSFDQSTQAIGSANQAAAIQQDIAGQMTAQQNAYAGSQAIQQGVNQAIMGGVGGAMAGGGVGAVLGAGAGVVNTAIGYGQTVDNNNKNLAIQNSAVRRNTANQVGSMKYNRDTNKNFADYAAKGDYQNTIAGLNAKVQDAQLLQPSVSGQVGGDAFNFTMIGWAIWFKVKLPAEGVIERIGEYWLRYGYAVNRFTKIPQNLHVMQNFTYWKLKETYITAAGMPETFKQTIRGIMEKGVTVWADPDDMGTLDPGNNDALTGIRIGY